MGRRGQEPGSGPQKWADQETIRRSDGAVRKEARGDPKERSLDADGRGGAGGFEVTCEESSVSLWAGQQASDWQEEGLGGGRGGSPPRPEKRQQQALEWFRIEPCCISDCPGLPFSRIRPVNFAHGQEPAGPRTQASKEEGEVVGPLSLRCSPGAP